METRSGLDGIKDRASRTVADEHEYLKVTIECLGCGRKARVRVTSLDRTLACKGCATIMHMGRDGVWRLGPPPKNALQGAIGQWRLNERYWQLTRMLQNIPVLRHRLAPVAVLIIVLVPFVIWGAKYYYRSTAELPATLIGRAAFLAHCLRERDDWQFELVVDGSTDDDANRWFETVQDELESAQNGATSEMAVHVAFENAAERLGCVVIDFRKPGAAAADSAEDDRGSSDSKPRFLRVVTFWRLDADSGWLLDGRRTLSDYKSTSS